MGTAESPVWSVYLLRCADGSLYTGIAIDVDRRLRSHVSGPRGAKYLKGRGPYDLVFRHAVGSRGRAGRIEHRIKKLPKKEKERLLGSPSEFRNLIDAMSDGTGGADDAAGAGPRV